MRVTYCKAPVGAFFAASAWSTWTFRGELYRRQAGQIERFVGGLWIPVACEPAQIGRVDLAVPGEPASGMTVDIAIAPDGRVTLHEVHP
ncbi:MAG: hypothetical protein AB7O67_16695 [Vicinamibacterales bacterium]